jgi:hypothetical protein
MEISDARKLKALEDENRKCGDEFVCHIDCTFLPFPKWGLS